MFSTSHPYSIPSKQVVYGTVTIWDHPLIELFNSCVLTMASELLKMTGSVCKQAVRLVLVNQQLNVFSFATSAATKEC